MATAGDEQQQQAAAAQTAEVTEAAAKEVVSVEMPAPEGWTKKFTPQRGGRFEIVFVSPSNPTEPSAPKAAAAAPVENSADKGPHQDSQPPSAAAPAKESSPVNNGQLPAGASAVKCT
ncbi:Os12g0620400 [Oryza sativa Japonica Group]|uniref:Os12g0620400 protein n=1 Tax=Oryza sativa subsp. japonica TaxID=39947 RepID=A0A0N7KUD7_ORYSJ|nr:hypothetical protein EE612_061000 [Oryza sativa]BAT18130.1 Os12g0620400 [Oryza sativa Japonica Group]